MTACEAFAWTKLGKGVGDEVGAFVNPCGKVFLPLRYYLVGIVGVTVGLGVRIGVMALVLLAEFHAAHPPVVDAVVGLAEVALAADHGVEEELSGEAIGVDHVHGPLALGNLGIGSTQSIASVEEMTGALAAQEVIAQTDKVIDAIIDIAGGDRERVNTYVGNLFPGNRLEDLDYETLVRLKKDIAKKIVQQPETVTNFNITRRNR